MPQTATTYGFGVDLELPYEEAIALTKAALKDEGFGVLSEIDMRKTMKEKIDADFEPYIILGACNPQLAWRGLQAEHELGLLLPCNVIVHSHGDHSRVSFLNPEMMSEIVGTPEMKLIADEATARLRRVMAALAA